ncbi:MAG: hypothetical protein WBA22_07440 [Candidatus Methanofastidiosia archaeon]
MGRNGSQRYNRDLDSSSDLEKIVENLFSIRKTGKPEVIIVGDFNSLGRKPSIKHILFEYMASHWTIQDFDVSEHSQIMKKKSDLLKAINDLQSCLDDPTESHIQYFRFKEELKNMRNLIDSRYWDLSRLVVGCMDASTNTPALDLNFSQVDALKEVIGQITVDIDCSTVNSLLKVLISAGLKPVPDLQNLEPMEI